MKLALIGSIDRFSSMQLDTVVDAMDKRGIANPLKDIQHHDFHISFADFELACDKELVQALNSARINWSLPLLPLYELGNFPGGVLFFKSEPSDELKDLHRSIHKHLEVFTNENSYYLPDIWLPHLTLNVGLSQSEMCVAYEVIRALLSPLKVRIETYKLIEVIYDGDKIIDYKLKWEKKINN